MQTLTISSAIASPGRQIQTVSGTTPTVTLGSSSSSTSNDNDLFGQLSKAVIQVAIQWLITDLQNLGKPAVELTNIVLQQIGQHSYVVVSANTKHVLTIKAHSEWEAQVVVFVGQQPLAYHLNHQDGTYQQTITGPGTLCVHIIPLGGKGIEPMDPTGHVSYDVSCDLYFEDGSHVGQYSKNGWDPKGSDFSSSLFNYT